jgi:hypothetical protein
MPEITKRFGVDFTSEGGALTLPAVAVREDYEDIANDGMEYERLHPDGWRIRGEVHEDYYYWVNKFFAVHLMYGRVWGNFESEVYADCEEGFKDFYEKHPPTAWDYGDI